MNEEPVTRGARPRARVLLFDWLSGGHHAFALRWFSEAILGHADVWVAAPTSALGSVQNLPVGQVPLGEARPSVGTMRRWKRVMRDVDRREVRLFHEAIEASGATHALHLFADGVIAALTRAPVAPAPISVLIFRPRTHYPRAYDSALSVRERITGIGLDGALGLWLRRGDARVAMTYDAGAARHWQRRHGSRTIWLTEAPVPTKGGIAVAEPRTGYVMAGSISPRKGVEAVARAIGLAPWHGVIRFVGPVNSEFREEFACSVSRIEGAGGEVELFDTFLTDAEYLSHIARSNCSIVAYPRHIGMSRVLLESAAVGTPVIAHDWGLLGHLVKEWNLGVAVDCRDRRKLRNAIDRFADPSLRSSFEPFLSRFAGMYSARRFVGTLRCVWADQD